MNAEVHKLALAIIASRDVFVEELRQKLLAKGHSRDDVEEVVSYIQKRKLLDDENTTRNLIARNSGKRAIGIERMRAELERRGAPEAEIEAGDESQRALEALRAKYKAAPDRGKAGRFLYGRGFAEEAIEAALEQFCGDETFPE